MPKEINILANTILKNPIRIAVTPVETTLEAIKQSVFLVRKKDKTNLLIHLLKDKGVTSALVFSRTKHGANKILKDLLQADIKAEAIHGNKSQQARTQALNDFKSKKIKVLVATDIAARGIDIDELSHVINYDLPEVPETYIHRIGRTGRAGLGGIAYSFVGEQEINLFNDIQKHIKMTLPVITDHPYAISMSMLSSLQPLPAKVSHSQGIPKSFHSSRKAVKRIR
jgi:ATP-dependent RNA helicase RhlE